jgi:hypothetical protein
MTPMMCAGVPCGGLLSLPSRRSGRLLTVKVDLHRMTHLGRTSCSTAVLRRSGIGASRPLRRIPAIVSFLNPEPALSLVGGNRSLCPFGFNRAPSRRLSGDALSIPPCEPRIPRALPSLVEPSRPTSVFTLMRESTDLRQGCSFVSSTREGYRRVP